MKKQLFREENLYKITNNVLTIPCKNFSSFFDPQNLYIFSKENDSDQDEEIIDYYLNSRKLAPIEKGEKLPSCYEAKRVTIELDITEQCNLRCQYCYIKNYHFNKGRTMSKELIEQVFNFAFTSFPKADFFCVDVFGGEPLLVRENLEFLINKFNQIFKNKQRSIGISTNGTIVDEKTLNLLKKNNIRLQISLDGKEAAQNFLRPYANQDGSYLKIIKNLADFQILSNLVVRSTITPYNMNIGQLFLYFKKLGFRYAKFELCITTQPNLIVKAEDIIKALDDFSNIYLKHLIEDEEIVMVDVFHRCFFFLYFKKRRLNRCGLGNGTFSISTGGNIYACHGVVGNDKFKLGDLKGGIDESNLMQRDFLNFDIENEKNCKKCFAKYFCGGECLVKRDLPTHQLFCIFTRYAVFQAIRIYSELKINHHRSFIKLIKRVKKIF